MALAWLLSKRAVCSVLVGANKLAQLEDNLGAVNVRLSEQELRELNEISAPTPIYPNWFSARVDGRAGEGSSGRGGEGVSASAESPRTEPSSARDSGRTSSPIEDPSSR